MKTTETKPNPFGDRAKWKPRSQWKRRLKGRRTEEVGDGLFVFEMRTEGVAVRKKHGRKVRLWPWSSLANGVNPVGQMEMFK